MTTYTIEHNFLPDVAQNGKAFKEEAPATYQAGDVLTWTVHVNDEGMPVDMSARRRRGVKPAVEARTFTLTIDGTGKEFMNGDGEMRQRFYGELTTATESL